MLIDITSIRGNGLGRFFTIKDTCFQEMTYSQHGDLSALYEIYNSKQLNITNTFFRYYSYLLSCNRYHTFSTLIQDHIGYYSNIHKELSNDLAKHQRHLYHRLPKIAAASLKRREIWDWERDNNPFYDDIEY